MTAVKMHFEDGKVVHAERRPAWDAYKPDAAWYSNDAHGIHGIAHAARVLVWANLIGLWMIEQGKRTDLETVRWSASVHDVRRENDGKDPLHGHRSAAWVIEAKDGRIAELGAECKGQLAYCCRWHVPPDAEAPLMTPELMCLKDGDSLDRVRLGGLNPSFLRTDIARTLAGQAQFLCATSEAHPDFPNDPWNAVQRAALNMGLWSPLLDTAVVRARLRFFEC
jgi:hypothetical protein